MTHDDAFLQAICERPADDTPRLVYADWLEEHGQPDRAEFIRIQCRLPSLSEEDSRRPELLRRQERLLRAHKKEWLGCLRGLVRGQSFQPGYEFWRGFVMYIRMSAAHILQCAEQMVREHPVDRVEIVSPSRRVRALAECSSLSHLTSLTIQFPIWHREDLRPLFQSLNLDRLQELDLSGIELEEAGVEALAASSLLSHLTRLNLSTTALGVEGVEALVASPSLRGLTDLSLSNQGFGLRGVQAVASCPHLAGLTSLGLSFNYVGEGCGEALASSPYLGNLTHLGLYESDLTDAGAEALAASPYLNRLEHLDVRSNVLNKQTIQRLQERFSRVWYTIYDPDSLTVKAIMPF